MVQVGGGGKKLDPPIFLFLSFISKSIIVRILPFSILHPLVGEKNPIDFSACRSNGGLWEGGQPPF